ncbi:MAG: response regulator [Bacteroidota bacterium]
MNISNKSIVIVEDDVIAQMTLQHMLSDMGFQDVQCFSDEASFIKTLQDGNLPDLILMDVYIKGMRQGISITQSIQADYNIPIIFITASSDPETLRQLENVKHHGVLHKPYEYERILESIQHALESSDQ